MVARSPTHEGSAVRKFYAGLKGRVVVGLEATGSMQWFLERLDELGIECRVGHPAEIPVQYRRLQCSMFQVNTNQTTPMPASAISVSPIRLQNQRSGSFHERSTL